MRVLIVDDEPLARARLDALLRECPDVDVVGSVGDGEAALAALSQTQPDLLLLDINMPGMDGKALAARLANRARPQVVFCTAY
jgi:two-component system response regulator AlgR